MAWSGGVFTQKVGPSPIFTGPTVWEQDAQAGILIEAERHDYHDQDLADGINACLNKNGENSPTSDIDWGGFKTTNHGAGSATTDVANYGQTITAAALNSGTNVLTLTRATGGNVTVDLSALAVGGSTTDFARYSNALNPFQHGATFGGTLGALYTVQLVDTVTVSGSYTWAFGAATPTLAQIANTAGAQFNFSGNSGAATFSVNGAAVWTTASLPASTFAGVLTATTNTTITGTWAVTAPWTFTNSNLKLPGFLWSAGVGGTTWTAGPVDATTLAFNEPGGTKNLLYIIDAATTSGAYLQVGASAKRVWDQGSLQVLATAAPTGGQDGNLAVVLGGANQGLWAKASGSWSKIINGP